MKRPGALKLLLLRVIGAGLLFAAGGIHLDLYLTGYKYVPTVGYLFLVEVAMAFAIALAVLVSGRRRIVTSAAALFLIGTLAGYVAFRIWTIFGFHEIGTTAGSAAGIIELAGFAVLATHAVFARRGGSWGRRLKKLVRQYT